MIQLFHRFWRHTLSHSHEVLVALVLEGSRANVALLIGLVGVVLVCFAVQVAMGGSE